MATFLQWNCRGLRGSWVDLRVLISRYSPACICLQETMIGQSDYPSPPGYRAFYSSLPGQGHSGGTAILVRNDIPYTSLHLNTPLQAAVIQIFLNRPYTVCSLYLPPSDPISRVDLHRLVGGLPSPFLLLGDFNGRHPLWGDCAANPRGELVSDFIGDEGLGVLNSGDMTHFHVQNGTFTAIDLSLCSSDAVLDFNWQVLPDLYGSDHFPILLELAGSEPRPRLPRWRLNKADWKLFTELATPARSAEDFSCCDEAAVYFTDVLQSAALQSVPKTSGRFPKRPVPWWTDECTAAVRARRAAFSRVRRHRGDRLCLEDFRRARARARRTLKTAQKDSWRGYVSSITSLTPLTHIFNRVRKIAGKFTPSPPPVLSHGGDKVAEPKIVADLLADHFSNVSRKDPAAPMADARTRSEALGVDFTSAGGESYNVPFSMPELKTALSQCQDSSPGSDDIPYVFLRHMPDPAFSFLLELYNSIWSNGDFPSSWRTAVVIPIPKPGKDHLQVSNYRPISLTSCLCKVLEKMVNSRLVWYLESGGYLSPVQYGFRKVRSTSHALLSLESSVCEAFACNHHQVTVFFDIGKAYDTAWCHGILLNLFDFGLRGRLPNFVRQFLSQRLLRVRVGSELSKVYPLENGVPQGSILSVTLFAVAINGVCSALPVGVTGSLYVDDLCISFHAARMSLIERKLQLAINAVSQWATERGFRFSSSKTVAMHFCRLRGVHPDPDLYLGNRRISCVEETRYLGLVFDSRLTWVPHLKYIKSACQRVLSLLRVLAHTSWGADRDTLLLLHRVLILSKLEYGCEVYSSATEARLRVLDSVHHTGIRLATGAFRTSPIPSLLVEAGFLPLDLRRQSLLLRCWYRVHRLPDSLLCTIVSHDSQSRLYVGRPSLPKPFGYRVSLSMETLSVQSVPICPFRFPKVGFWQLPQISVCSPDIAKKGDLLPCQSHALFHEHLSEHSDSVAVYTDGSKSAAGVGYGVVFPSFSRGASLPQAASVFTAELSAIILALQVLFTLPVSSFTIFSDSRSVLAALRCFNPSSFNPHVLAAMEWLYLLHRKGYRISFCWVPAHVGVPGNEKADRLAREAAARAPPLCPVPYRDVFPLIRTAVTESWQRRWEAEAATAKMGELTLSVSRSWTYFSVRSRIEETLLCRLRIGHTRLTQGYLLSGDAQPFCDDCLVPLTVRHLLVECPSLGDLRRHFLSGCQGVDGAFDISRILGVECLSPGHEVLRFLEEAGFLYEL